jgi:replicative DNA helicase
MGKTAFMLSMAFNLGQAKIPGAIFSLEMTALQLINRLTAIQTEIPLQFLTMQTVEGKMHDRLMEGVPMANAMPIYIDDPASLSIFEFRAKARRYKMKYDIQYIIVDYLQLLEGVGGNREQQISNISRTLKSVAKELKIPVIALSQLSREVEKRDKTKKPQLSDLRESGSLEQDADMVLFPFRPEYYDITTDDNGQDLPEGYAEINIAKHRDGAPGEVEIRFRKNLSRYENILAQYAPAPIENYYEKHEKPDLDNPF